MKHTIIFIILTSILSLTGCNSDLLPSALASDTQDTVSDVKADSDAVFQEIQRNIDLVTELKTKVQDAQISSEPLSLDSVIKDIETITESYERLASQKENIGKALLQKVANLERIRTTVDTEIKALNGRKADYLEQLRLLDNSDPEIYRTRQKALSRAIGYVDSQISLWQKFSDIQGDIILETSDIGKRIDLFLSMIESTAIVFHEGLALLRLQEDINQALALFSSDFPRIVELTDEMEKSWDTLDFLLGALTGVANMRIAE